MTGTTGRTACRARRSARPISTRVRAASNVPVCAGFGIRSREQVEQLRGHVDGVIVGSALVEVLEKDRTPAAFLRCACAVS